MKLVLSSWPSVRLAAEFEASLDGLQRRHEGQLRMAPFDLAALGRELREPDVRLLLLTAGPLESAEWGFAGQEMEAALEGWAEQAEAALSLFRGDRRRVFLVDAGEATRAGDGFLGELEGWMAGGPPPSGEVAPIAPPFPADRALVRLVAAAAVQQTPRRRRLAEEFTAALLPLGAPPEPDLINPSAAAAELQRLLTAELTLGVTRTSLQEALADAEAARADAAQTLAKSMAYTADLEAQREAMRRLQGGLAKCQESIEQEIREAERLEQANRRVTADLARATAERDALASQQEELAAEYAALVGRVHALKTGLDTVKASTSWKVTAPLRGTKMLFSRSLRRAS